MAKIEFNLSNYKKELSHGLYSPPRNLCPYYDIDPVLYTEQSSKKRRGSDLSIAFTELRKRTGKKYFYETYPLQSRTLDYSAMSFPAYRFILPEVMTEDWLGIMDWGKIQRDHVLHQPLTGYVILKLLEENPHGKEEIITVNSETLLTACVNMILKWDKTAYIKDFLISTGMNENDPILDPHSSIAKTVWRSFFLETAYVAAVFHDLGYPWQYAERLQNNLDGINAPVVKQNKNPEQIFDLFGQRLIYSPLNGYKKIDPASPSTWRNKILKLTDELLSQTHGFPGALGFLHLNDFIRRYPCLQQSPLHLLCVEWAATAIMMHDMKKTYWGKNDSMESVPENPFLRLSFEKDPLSAIVTLADVIQEFERPSVVYEDNDDDVILKYNTACSGTEIEINDKGILTICYIMNNKESNSRKRNSILKDSLEYFDSQYGYLDMSSIGITKVNLTTRLKR